MHPRIPPASRRKRSLLHDRRGGGTVEKIVVVGVLLVLVVVGVRKFGASTSGALDCQGSTIAAIGADGKATCVNASGAPAVTGASGAVASLGSTLPAAPTLCDGINCMCFVAGTLVTTSAGPQAIDTIQPGTLVLARDQFGDALDWKPVLETYVSRTHALLRLTVALSDGTQDLLEVTPNHPFFAQGRGWIEAGALVPGQDLLLDQGGQPVALLSAQAVAAEVSVYNLDVADHHTYFAGRLGVWAHNQGNGRICSAPGVLADDEPTVVAIQGGGGPASRGLPDVARAGPVTRPAAGPQRYNDLDRLYQEATIAQGQLSTATIEIANKTNGKPLVPPGPKTKERAEQKIMADYDGDASRITDLARSSVIFENMDDLNAGLAELRSRYKVVGMKDRFAKPLNGYRDMLLTIEMDNGHVAEVQLHLDAMLKAKEEGGGHKLYEAEREIVANAKLAGRPLTAAEIEQIAKIRVDMKTLYEGAYASTQKGAGR